MIPVNTHPTLVRLSRSSINIIKRSNQRTVLGASSSSSNAVYQKRTFISIVNPDAPTIVKIRKSAAPKIAETVETEKVLSLRNFLSNPKPTEKIETNTIYNVDSVAETFTEALQLAPDKTGFESPETQTLNKLNVPKTETSSKEGREETKRVEKDDIGLKTVEALNQNQEGVIVEKEVKVAEETHEEAVKVETSMPNSQEDVTLNEDADCDQSDDESDSSSDSDSSTSSSSSDSESDIDDVNRDDLARKRLDQAPLNLSSPKLDLNKLVKVKPHKPSIKFYRNRDTSFMPQPTLHSQLNIIFNKSQEQESNIEEAAVSNVLEWWQRPKKFDRQGLDADEIDNINSGGAENIFN